ncbi:MAG: MlaA family lipoprotein, partial [Candidatus Competibacter denitrificans]
MHKISRRLPLVFAITLLVGCAATTTPPRDDSDPLENYNRTMFAFNDAVDKAVLKPVARAYQTVLPAVVI